MNTDEVFLIIRIQEEFDQYVNISDCNPQINFDEFDLVIGSTYVSENSTFGYDVVYNCGKNYTF
ncbi:MAG: hypothetical protein ACK5IC_07790 [Moheibacter sp.]